MGAAPLVALQQYVSLYHKGASRSQDRALIWTQPSCGGLQEAGKGKEFQKLLAEIEDAGSEGGALDKACSELQALISSLKVPANLAKEAGKSTSALSVHIVNLTFSHQVLQVMESCG